MGAESAQGTTVVIIIRNNYEQQLTNQRQEREEEGPQGVEVERWPTPLLQVGDQLQQLKLDLDGQSGWSVSLLCGYLNL